MIGAATVGVATLVVVDVLIGVRRRQEWGKVWSWRFRRGGKLSKSRW